MIKLFTSLAIVMFASHANAQIINIPDANFKARLLAADVTNNTAQDINNNNIKIDINSDGEIDQSEALLVYRLFYTTPPPLRFAAGETHSMDSVTDLVISDLTGISYFIKLRRLDVSNNLLTTLNVTGLNYLEYLNCSNNNLTSLTLTGLINLHFLDCSNNVLPALYLSSLVTLDKLYCHNNQLTTLDVSNLGFLTRVLCYNNQMENLQFGANPILDQVYCYSNQLSQIDLSDTAASVLYCNDNPTLTSINLNNGVNSELTFEQPPFPLPINSFDFANLPMLQNICCDAGESAIISEALAGQPGVTIDTACAPQIVNIPDSNFKNMLLNTNCASFEEGVPNASYNSRVDTNLDGEIQLSEATAVKGLKVNTNVTTTTGDILSVEGIQYFTNLQQFHCGGNQIQSLDVTMMADLKELNCQNNNITSLAVNGLDQLDLIRCYNNNLATLNLNDLPALRFIECSDNNLTTLDVTNLPTLQAFVCSNNQISNLALTNMPALVEIQAFSNDLTGIDFTGSPNTIFLGIAENLITDFNLLQLPNIRYLDISSNDITTLNTDGHMALTDLMASNTLLSEIDCSQSGVQRLWCQDNPNLTSINIQNGIFSMSDPDMLDYAFNFSNLPMLTSICIDAQEQYSVGITPYNSNGNTVVYTGVDCSIVVTMSTEHFEGQAGISIFPNPTNHTLNVFNKSQIGIDTILIYNTLGQLVKSVNLTGGIENAIEVDGLASGTYYIKFVSNTGASLPTAKFIKI